MRANWRAVLVLAVSAFVLSQAVQAQNADVPNAQTQFPQAQNAEVQSPPARTKCATVFATDDGLHKSMAVKASLVALEQEIKALKAKRGLRQASISPARPTPNPYWRGRVTANLYQKPDIVSSTAHTICWRGVVSPSVCTSGAKVCW